MIANASGGTGELVVHGESGWLLSEDAEAQELAVAMREAWTDRARAEGHAAAARHAVQRFSLEAMARGYLGVLAPPEAPAAHEKMAAWIPAAASRST